MDVYLLVTFIIVLATLAGAVLMSLDSLLKEKRDKKYSDSICNDVVPAVGEAIKEVTKEMLETNWKSMTGWMNENSND